MFTVGQLIYTKSEINHDLPYTVSRVEGNKFYVHYGKTGGFVNEYTEYGPYSKEDDPDLWNYPAELEHEFEYVVRLDDGAKPAGRFVFDNEDEARKFARILLDGSQSNFNVKLIKSQVAPTTTELEF